MGGIEAIWPAPLATLLEQALSSEVSGPAGDQRMRKALERGGRNLASEVAATVQNARVGA